MPTLVFRLRNVPDDEADEVRALLDEGRIDWYETSAGNWGIAMPGLWVKNSDEAPRARTLIDAYQNERATRMATTRGQESAFARLRERPVATLAIIAFCLFILYVSIDPFIALITASAQ